MQWDWFCHWSISWFHEGQLRALELPVLYCRFHLTLPLRDLSAIQVQNSVVFVATSAEQAELFRVVREGHPIPESTCWTSPIVIQPVEKRPFWSNWKQHVLSLTMETRPRQRKRLSERIPECLSDFALLVAGDAPSLAACFFSIWGRVSGMEFKIELKSFVWRPSEQIDFFANSCATPKRWQPYLSPLWHG